MAGTELYPIKENILPTPQSLPIGSTLPVAPFVASEQRKDDFLPPPASGVPQVAPMTSTGELYEARKFAMYDPSKTEEQYAYGQSAWDKAGNGLAKLAGTTAITLADNTVGLLYGMGAALGNLKFSSLYDNDFFKHMDEVSKEMENKFPHYYTAAEQKNPLALSSVFTGNFFWDKIVKNLGFSAGAAITGFGASAALEAIGLSKGLVAAGKGLQALEATEDAVAEGKAIGGIIQALKNPKPTLSRFGGVLEELGTVAPGAKYSKGNQLLAAYLGTTGEAGLESYQNKKQFVDAAKQEFRDTHGGQEPTGADLAKIEDYAAQVGNWSFALNTALLTGTEYIQLPKIFGSTYSGEKRTLNNLIFEKGLWRAGLPKEGFGKFLYQAGNVGSLFFNTAEAFEEGAQYAIQEGTNKFFDKKYRNNEQTNFWNSLAGIVSPMQEGVVGYGIKQAVTSDQGLENILLGGLSGALMTAGVVGTKTNEKGQLRPAFLETGKIGERGFTGYGGEKGEFFDSAVKALNSSKFSDLVDSINRGLTLTEDREKSLRLGDILQSKDLETDYMLNYLQPRIKYGGRQVFMTEINDMRERAGTDELFKGLQDQGVANENETRLAFLKRLDNIQNMATEVTNNYDKFNASYAGVVKTDENGDPILDKDGKPQRKYDDKVIDKMVYTVSKIFDYNNRIPGLVNNLSSKDIVADELLAETVLNGKPSLETAQAVLDSINKLSDTDGVKDDLKTNLQDALELTMRRNNFIREFNSMKKDPSKFEEGVEEGVETVKVKQTFEKKGKEKTISKELEVGKEYTLADPLSRSENKLTVNPTITVLSKTLQGEYEVKLPDGTRTFLSPEDFKKYQISAATQDTETIKGILDKAIAKVLGKDKYKDLPEVTGDLLDYINSLDNPELINDIQKEFTSASSEYLVKKAKEEKLMMTKKLKEELQNTADELSIPTEEISGDYEVDARKTDQQVQDSSTPATKKYNKGEPLAAHHVRANQFGANYYNLPGNENFRGIVVTSKNEKEIGLPGLTQWLKEKGTNEENIEPTQTVVLVVMGTDPVSGGRFFVGVDGQRLENPTLENTIYQVFPKDLTWSDGESMFRDANESENRVETIQAYTAEYKKWRESILNSPTDNLYKIEASFGNPEYEGELDEYGVFQRNYNARINVEQAGLIFDNALRTKRVLDIPTSNDAQTSAIGSSTISNAKGLPILLSPNGLVKIDNRQFTRQEAELMFDVIEKLANNLFNDKNLKSGESQALYNWLKSVVYWGTPNNKPGYSSVLIDDMKLKIGKDGLEFSIQPSDLEQNRTKIIDELSKLYHNVNSSLVKGTQNRPWNAKYTEITGIRGGKIETREWDNYQSYLLSNTDPQGNFRDNVPLTTQIRALKSADDTNRQGIYFTLMDKKGNTSEEVKQPAIAQQKTLPAPTKLVGPAKTTISVANIGDITYTVDMVKYEATDGKEGITLDVPEATFDTILNKLIASTSSPITEDSSTLDKANAVNNVASNFVVRDINKVVAPIAPAAPAPVVSNIDDDARFKKITDSIFEIKEGNLVRPDYLKPENVEIYTDDEGIGNILKININGVDHVALMTEGQNLTFESFDKLSKAKDEFEGLKKVSDVEKANILKDYANIYDLEVEFLVAKRFGKDDADFILEYLSKNKGATQKLAALESKVPTTTDVALEDKLKERRKAGKNNRSSEYRLQFADNSKKFQTEDWKKVAQWLTKNFPNLPVYKVKNMIQATNGKLAWGMLQDGGIYLYENAPEGTAYHEVFEAVWKMFTSPEERAEVAAEFRNRKGSYTDVFTARDIKYSEATDQDIKEKLAEEFKDYILGKQAKEGKSLISRLFSQLVDFIKSFFIGDDAKQNTDKLFSAIGSGYYATFSPNLAGLSFAQKGFVDLDNAVGGVGAEYSLEAFSGSQINEIMQHMTYTTVKDLFQTDEGLFNITADNKNIEDLYNSLKEEMENLALDNIVALEEKRDDEITPEDRALGIQSNETLYRNIVDNWDSLRAKHIEYLKNYSIEFDENDNAALSTTEKTKDSPFGDPTKIDSMKKANAAVKLLLASLPVVNKDGSLKQSSIGGYTLVPMSEAFISVMNNTHSSRSITEMMSRIKGMSTEDPKYIKLYNRLSKLKAIDDLNTEADLQMLASIWKTFKKQAPTVKNVYILENGDVQVGDANFSSAARQIQAEFIEDIKGAINDGSKYFKYNVNKNLYYGVEGSIKEGDLENLKDQVDFLKELGIEFDYSKLVTMPEKSTFSKAVNGIRQSINQAKQIVTFTGKSLSIDKRLRQLAEIKTKMDNPEFSSTFYNVNGEMTQTFIGTNAASDLYDALSQINNINELKNTPYEYLLTDTFAKNSTLLWAMFDKQSGDRIKQDEDAIFNDRDLLHVGYAGGVVNEDNGKQKESSSLTYKDRLLQEINLNTEGWYLNLIPGDASIEWMLFMGNRVSKSDILLNFNTIHNIFRGYFIDEVNLSRDDKRQVAKGRNKKDLRFFKSILGTELHDEIIEAEGTPEDIYDSYTDEETKINAIANKVSEFVIKEREKLKRSLTEYALLRKYDNGYTTKGLTFGKELMSEEELNRELDLLSANYAINNIELHKLLYSDPYQYSEELKRIKSFSSPRQSIISNSVEMNTALDNVWNKKFKPGQLGHTNFNIDHFRTMTFADVTAMSEATGTTWTETDGAGVISLPAHRNFKIRAGEWDGDQERQYIFDMKYEEAVNKKASQGSLDKMMLKNPGIKRMYTPVKPIVSGNKANGQNYNDIVLDKFALYPLSFRVLHQLNPNSNAIKLYKKMQEENVDYGVYDSGRKVGTQGSHNLYNADGSFNETLFDEDQIINVPFSIMAVQSEVPSKDTNDVTRGSQMTKLATLDYMAAGVPIDFMTDTDDFTVRYEAWYALTEDEKMKSELYAEIKNNQNLLEKMMEAGYQSLLKTLDIQQVDGGWKIDDVAKTVETLKRELTKREINDNILEALQGFKNGVVVFEATPAYQQIRNILYSIADREVISPKINGGMKVQIPSTLLESVRAKEEKGAYTSNVLNFYVDEDGKRVCEIMVARWFESDLSDEELLEELNNSPILEGVGFRIPTQKQNSIDVFKIAKFLPKDFGDSVVVPSQLVEKVGSDFDIDKLSIYLKNVDDNERGVPRMLSTKGDKIKNLENAYIESLQKLVSHPLNFERLTTPNSAKQLKGLATEITDKLGFGSFDYNATGNMLNRQYMSRLRHAFVTGKYAIGIAAVNQTNHSLNQRTSILLDFEGRKDLLDDTDLYFLKDGKIKFDKVNRINGLPTLSMIKNEDGEFISDILGQFIDGYVDISKGPWIMELGATPNVASTWMFLVKVGVPIKTVAYFMNQPIIREYLRDLERKGYTWLFNKTAERNISKRYNSRGYYTTKMPTEEQLFSNIGRKEFTPVQKSEQKFILGEFLKYAKMAEHMFRLTQGTNFDTASFNDPFLVFKKSEQLNKARKTIFSSADNLLEQSFLGKLGTTINDVRNALAEILRVDKGNTRQILQDVLTPYVEMNDRDFIRTSQRAVATLFDWAVQTNKPLNDKIKEALLVKDNYAQQIWDFLKPIQDPKNNHPLKDNQVIKLLKPNFGAPGEVNNIQIKNKNNKVYDQNQMIYAFNELKNFLKSEGRIDLYDKLVTLSVIQSGLTESNISFTNLLPYADVERMYNDTLFDLQSLANLPAFRDLNVFERTFWNYNDIVTHMSAEANYDYYTGQWSYNENMQFKDNVYSAIKTGELPQLLRLSSYDRESNDDIIVYTWEKGDLTQSEKNKMKKQGDFSFRKKGLFKKAGSYRVGEATYYIYKAINAWGDGKYANEFYATPEKSVIDNGFIQADESISDAKIMSYFGETTEQKVLPLGEQTTQVQKTVPTVATAVTTPVTNLYVGEDLTLTYNIDSNDYNVEGPDGVEAEGVTLAQAIEYGKTVEELDSYFSKIGDIIKIDNASFRLLDIEETDDPREHLLQLYSKSGLTTYAILNITDGRLNFKLISLEEMMDEYNDIDWKEEDNNDTCNPF